MNRLYFGDNLKWLSDRKEFPDASVDLVCLDPPFNSNADYNVLFREPTGQVSQAQFHAFTDTWSWADAADTYHQFIDTCPNVAVLAINLIKRRLKDAFGEEIEFEERGQPTDFASAKRLAELDKFQFQHWALSLI